MTQKTTTMRKLPHSSPRRRRRWRPDRSRKKTRRRPQSRRKSQKNPNICRRKRRTRRRERNIRRTYLFTTKKRKMRTRMRSLSTTIIQPSVICSLGMKIKPTMATMVLMKKTTLWVPLVAWLRKPRRQTTPIMIFTMMTMITTSMKSIQDLTITSIKIVMIITMRSLSGPLQATTRS